MSNRPTSTNRRTILKTTAVAALGGAVATNTAVAQTDLPVEIVQNAEEEYVVVTNVGDEEIDLTGYYINFEAGEDSTEDQIEQLAGEVTVPAGEEIVVPVGVNEISGDNVVQLDEPYDVPRLNNEDPDVVALLDPDQNVVVASDETVDGDPIEDDDDEEAEQEPDEEEEEDETEDEEQEPAEDEDEDEDATTDEDEEPEDDEDEEDEADAKGDDKKDKDDDGTPASEDVDDDCPKVS